MRRSERNLSAERRGTATVELAVVLPLLILLFLIGVDFARVYYFTQTLYHAAESGAIFASKHPDNAANTTKIEEIVLSDTSNLSPAPTVDTETGVDDSGNNYIRVTVSWDFNTVVNYPGLSGPYSLKSIVQMRIAPLQPREGYSLPPIGGGDV